MAPACRSIEVLRPVRVQDGDGRCRLSCARPRRGDRFDASLSIDFPDAAIGRQSLSHAASRRRASAPGLADARTFALAEDVARLHAAGLALGGSLDNAVVVDGAAVLNPGGLRRPDEFVRHKMLDVVGDLALAGRADPRPLHRPPLRPCAEQPAAAGAVRRPRQLARAAEPARPSMAAPACRLAAAAAAAVA